MIVGFQYTAMKITGAFHLGIGILCFIISMVGYSTKIGHYGRYQDLNIVTCTPAFIISLWVITVGIFGILAGRKSNTELQTRRMRITYMVLAILSACLCSHTGIGAFAAHALLIRDINRYEHLYPLFCVGSFAMVVEFVLAIVSSSICCCCSQTNTSVVIVHQNQATEFVNPSTERNLLPITHYSPHEFNEMK